MNETEPDPRDTFDLLGCQLLLALEFLLSGFDLRQSFKNAVTVGNFTGQETFEKHKGGIWLLRAEHLPGTLAVKAIAISKKRLEVELSLFDYDRVRELIADLRLPIEIRDRTFSMGGVKLFACFDKTDLECEGRTMLPRTHVAIPLSNGDAATAMCALVVLDEIYSKGCFIQAEAAPSAGFRPSMRLDQVQALEMHAELAIEQQPLLIMEQREKFVAALIFERKLRSLDDAGRADFLRGYLRKHGPKRLKDIIGFIQAGKERAAAMAAGVILSWKEARQRARQKLAEAV